MEKIKKHCPFSPGDKECERSKCEIWISDEMEKEKGYCSFKPLGLSMIVVEDIYNVLDDICNILRTKQFIPGMRLDKK